MVSNNVEIKSGSIVGDKSGYSTSDCTIATYTTKSCLAQNVCSSRYMKINSLSHKRKKSSLSLSRPLAVLALCALLLPHSSPAAGLLIADGGLGGVLEVKGHDVQVTINNGIA